MDTSRGKNLVGSFYQPKMVLIDPDLLKTLDEREVRSGMAEVIKYGAIYDNEFFDYLLGKEDLKTSMADIEKIIKKCCLS